jgi:predicted lipoprotein
MARITEQSTNRVVERIPHKDVAYAYLEIEAGSWNEFEALRKEVTTNHPMYAFAADVPVKPKRVSAKSVSAPEPEARVAEVEAEVAATPPVSEVATPIESASQASASTTVARTAGGTPETSDDLPFTPAPNEDADSKGLSPREKARLRLKGA